MSVSPPSPDHPGFGVYIHWPFCAAKCPYCDFNSHVRHGGVDQARFAAALAAELRHMARRTPGRTVTSIFLGGGTPSLMRPETVEAVLGAVHDLWIVAEGAEITLEANPTSAEAENFRGYRAAGVNRLSLGVQSLNDVDLRFLGRLHSAAEALAAIEMARATFPRLSFDLIYARPEQTVRAWSEELRTAIGHAADHLSLYQLTIEPETPFMALQRAGRLRIPQSDEARALYDATQEITTRAGLPAYEISNHAVPGAESRHNLVYWRYGEYVGVGPGAHGRLIESGDEIRTATATERNPERWLAAVDTQGHGLVEDEMLDPSESGDEMLVMGLRLREGLDVARFERMTGMPLDPNRIADLAGHGLVEWLGPTRVRVTPEGWPVLDAVVAELAA